MGFLDNLESSLNNLERQEERDSSAAERRDRDRNHALAAAPSAEELKSSDWTKQLYEKAAVAGHRIRAKIYIAWIGTTLRLEARGERLDLVPGASGVTANYEKSGQPVTESVNFQSDPDELLQHWLSPGEE